MLGLHPAYWFAAGCCYVLRNRKRRRNAGGNQTWSTGDFDGSSRGAAFVAQSQARHPAESSQPPVHVTWSLK